MRLIAGGGTDRGLVRDGNEDRFRCDAAAGVFVVADGVGGYAGGDVAAEMACDVVGRRLGVQDLPPERRLRAAIAEANNAILEAAATDPARGGMACVLTAVLVEDDRAFVGHVGDTRLYLVRPDEMRKITRDHSLVGAWEDAGRLSEAEAMGHPLRNEILREVGSAYHRPDDPEFVDVYDVPLPADGVLLLCSDGLTDLIPQDAIHETLWHHRGDPAAAVRALIEAANGAGGYDNVTVVVVRPVDVLEGEAKEKSRWPAWLRRIVRPRRHAVGAP